MKISDILRFFGLLPQKEIFYIGGSDVLPMPLKGAQEQEALEALERGEEGAKEQLVEHNLRLVVYIARRFENTGINLEDLISIGTIGLTGWTRRSSWQPMLPGASKMKSSCTSAKPPTRKPRCPWMSPSTWTVTATSCCCRISWAPRRI